MTEAFHGWAIRVNYRNRPGAFLTSGTYRTRADAIRAYDKMCGQQGQYATDRRKGEVLAVRVVIQEQETGQ